MSNKYLASDKMLLKSHDRRQIVTFQNFNSVIARRPDTPSGRRGNLKRDADRHGFLKGLAMTFATFFLWLTVNPAFAAMSLTFTGLPSSINQDEEISVQVSLTGAPVNTIYYLRAAFYVDATTQYFGYTWNNSTWNNTPSEYKKFLQINTGPSGEFNGTLKTKVDLLSNYFKGTGEYQFKTGRYTEGGSGPTWSDSLATTIIGPTPTPTATPTPTPTPTSAPIPTTTSSPTKTPTSTPTTKPTAAPSSTPTAKPSIILNNSDTENSVSGNEDLPEIDLAINDAMNPSPANEPEVLGTDSTKNSKPSLPVILIIAGALLTLAGGILLAYQEIKNKSK